MKTERRGGASVDAVLLTFIKLVTILLGMVITRFLSQHFSVYDYGTYSQVLLLVSTASSLTILGMMDGVNYFYCREKDEGKRESYIATFFSLQCIAGAIWGLIVLVLSGSICTYFDNPDLRRLVLYGAALPLLQNLLGMLQVMLVSVGKARLLALRNLVVSLARLTAVLIVVAVVKDVAAILLTSLLLDMGQVLFFVLILRKNGCLIRIKQTDFRLAREIFCYCIPMAVFVVVNTLNRDLDKYLISVMTDVETLAVYANASRILPFDIIVTSFCTVLLPNITRFISDGNYRESVILYRRFLQLSYISTGILCCAAMAVSPQLMQLLYSEKYVGGIFVFCIYIFVDLIRFTNITLVLSAAGKTKLLMCLGGGALAANALLNLALFYVFGVPGPAVATLLTTVATGVLMLRFSAREMQAGLKDLFEWKHLVVFMLESAVLTFALHFLQTRLVACGMHYLVIILVVGLLYGGVMLLLQGKHIFRLLRRINEI